MILLAITISHLTDPQIYISQQWLKFVTMTFPNHLVNHIRDCIITVLSMTKYNFYFRYNMAALCLWSMTREGRRPGVYRCRNKFFTLTFQYGESEKVLNVTAFFQFIVVGGCWRCV